ncbi:MAG: hypothetical protein AABY22_21645 [Nanoarchaeota archaeon]
MSKQFEQWFNNRANGGKINLDKALAHEAWDTAKKEIIKQIEKYAKNGEEIICLDVYYWEKIKNL